VNPNKLLAELKRRNVYKVAVLYAVVAWLLIQAGSILFPTFEAPEWVMKVFVTVVAACFPIALILAWAFELTPEGIKHTEDLDRTPQPQSRNRAWVYVVIIAGAISIGLFFLGRYTASFRAGAQRTEALEKSIAVLPFENLSDDKANAYFATGIQDEIMTRLAKIADLKVISRTSTQQYQSKPGNLSQIAKQLGVANVLEGSVQKVGEQVRVNVQLIRADHDSHLWAETYDRKLNDIFGVESDIAKSIAQSLQAKLSGHEERAFDVKPTDNPEAYDAYLRGLAAEGESIPSVYPIQKAISFYKRAVHLDPNFALAWGRLSRAHSNLYPSFGDSTEAAKRALETAQNLQPDSPETVLALAHYQYFELHDYAASRTTFLRVGKMLPGSSEIPAALAEIARNQGKWEDAVAYYDQALVFDPRNAELLTQTGDNYVDLRRFDDALKLYDRALEIRPNDIDLLAWKAGIYQAQGNLTEAAKFLASVNALTASYEAVGGKVEQLIFERNYREAVQLLDARFAQFQFGSELEVGVFQEFLASSRLLAGDFPGAKANAEQARNILEVLCKNQPDNDFPALFLTRTYAILGEKDFAYNEAQRVSALLRNDAIRGPGAEENQALIAANFGNNTRAISILAHLLQIPYQSSLYATPVTPALLRLDPTWDALRSDPTFQKLCQDRAH
jgi:TolB-like protein/cytochrome c-type biogenesis protein CcmH/NrfG